MSGEYGHRCIHCFRKELKPDQLCPETMGGNCQFRIPLPGDRILGGTVIASTYYAEAGVDGFEDYWYTLLVLMPHPPFYWVGIVAHKETGFDVTHFDRHMNIVPAVNGDPHPYDDLGDKLPAKDGYINLGGDY